MAARPSQIALILLVYMLGVGIATGGGSTLDKVRVDSFATDRALIGSSVSVLMVIGFTTGIAPMPKPIPEVLLGSVLSGLPKPAFMVVTIGVHFTYGGV